MKKVFENQSVYYWYNPKKGGLYPKGSTEAFNHILFVAQNEPLFDLKEGYVQEVFNLFNEPFGTEGQARLKVIYEVLKGDWLRARKWISGIRAEWYIEVVDKRYQKTLIKNFLEEIFDQVYKDDLFIIIDNTEEVHYSLKELFQLVESKDRRIIN